MASLLNLRAADLSITPDFIRKLHKDAFEELFPTWAGQYRDRNVTVGKLTPPPYQVVTGGVIPSPCSSVCLEEMLGVKIDKGALYWHGSRERKEIALTDALKAQVWTSARRCIR